jgi:FeS assembly SUF system protein
MSSDKAQEEHPLREAIIEAIRTVRDPEIPVNIWELGLIYEIRIDDGGNIHIDMTLTTPNCPVAELIPQQVEQAVASVDGVAHVSVDIVWEPEWTPDMMSEAAKLDLDFTGKFDPGKFQSKTNITIGRKPSDRR